MADDNYSRAARERRQAAWEAGKDYVTNKNFIAEALENATYDSISEPIDQYYFLLGVADTIYAAGRDLVGLDRREGPVEGKNKR